MDNNNIHNDPPVTLGHLIVGLSPIALALIYLISWTLS